MVSIAAVGDVHVHEESRGHLRPTLAGAEQEADVLVLAGDLTLSGSMLEAEILADELEGFRIPVVIVLGNHDCEMDHDTEMLSLLKSKGFLVLDGDTAVVEIRGQTVGFVGAKGFCGGFDKYAVAPFGERALKEFVHAGLREASKIESGLSILKAELRVVVLHYAPVMGTVVGESLELFPFLGSSHLAKPIDHFGADLVVHSHAHYGSYESKTKGGIPVFNVGRPIVGNYALLKIGQE